MDADGYRLLFDYNRLANDRVMERAAKVAETDYLATSEGMSFRTLHARLVHIMLAELVWLSRWQGEKPPEALKDGRRASTLAQTEVPTFARLSEMWGVEGAKQESFFATLKDEMIEAPLHYEDQYGNANTQPL